MNKDEFINKLTNAALTNVAAGIMLLILRPFNIGDKVKVAGKLVVVIDELGLFVTKAHEPEGPSFIIPNSKIWANEIINYSLKH